MSAYLEVGLPKDVVTAALRSLAPLRIHLAPPEEDRRWIELDPPQSVEFDPGIGVRVVTTGRFKYDMAGIKIPAHLDRVEFLLMPKIVQADTTAQRAAIPIEIVHGDVRFVPQLIDDWLVEQVNKALTPRASQLVWRFDEHLSTEFAIAERLEPLDRLALRVEGSSIVVGTDELTMRIEYDIAIGRRERPTLPDANATTPKDQKEEVV